MDHLFFLTILPIIAVAAVIAYCDYKTRLIPKHLLILLPIAAAPAAILSWQEILAQLPGSTTTIIIAALFAIGILAGGIIHINGVPVLDIGGADIFVLLILAAALPQYIILLAIAALILGCIISASYLLGRNKNYDAPFVQKCTMLGYTTTDGTTQTIAWQAWSMPLCVHIAAALALLILLLIAF